MAKLDKKVNNFIKKKYYKKKPVVKTKDTNKLIDFDNPDWERELKIGVLVAKIRANKKYYRDKYGAEQFDKWFAEIQKHPTVLKNQTAYKNYLKKLRKDTQFNHDMGLLTPKEFEELKGNRKEKYFKLIADRPDKHAFYIVAVGNKDMDNIRPTEAYLKEQKIKAEQKLKEREEYNRTHYVQPLTDAQKHFIISQAVDGKPYQYMGLPLSANNLRDVQKFQMLNSTLYVKPTTIPKIKIIDNIKPLDILRKQREALGELVQKATAREQQVLASLRVNFPAYDVNVGKGKADIEIKNLKTANTVATQHGLNSFKLRNKIKSNVDIAPEYLKQLKSGKIDYYVNSYQNAVALADAVGMLPQELFQILCNQIVKRKNHFKKQEFLNAGNAVSELIDIYKEWAKISEKRFDLKPSVARFYKSEQRKKWSKDYNYDWPNRVRFNEDFSKWHKIMTAEAKKKTK
jgi:hypothetical protein